MAPRRFAAVILDLSMPLLDGDETLREMLLLRRDVAVLPSSGYSELELAGRFAHDGPAGFIQKPYLPDELAHKLKAILQDTKTSC